MRLTPISAGDFHCDGGALFGVVPKVLWSKVYSANDNNFTRLALRCLLVESDDRKVLIETGIGNHYSDKHLKNNGVSSVTKLGDSLQETGISPDDITDVFFTHLHWDHCSGAVKNINDKLELTFPNASMWCSHKQWEHAKVSNVRERVAYHRKVLDFLYHSGKLNLLNTEGELFPGFEFRFFDGHTPGQMLPIIRTKNHTIAYTSDLIPTTANIPRVWVSAYDLDPVKVMEEKEKFLNEAAKENYILFFEHDFYNECARVHETEKGVQLKESFSFADLSL